MTLLNRSDQAGAANDRTAVKQKMSFDGTRYTYRGISFTREEAGVLSNCPQERLCAMVDATLASGERRAEIRHFGRRAWHSIVRPEPAIEQALDYAFGHDVSLVSRILPFVRELFETDPRQIDVWVTELRSAYARRFERKALLYSLLQRAGVPSHMLPSL